MNRNYSNIRKKTLNCLETLTKGIMKFICLLVCILAISSAQNPAIQHLNMKVKRLNRITDVLKQDVDDIWIALSSTTRNMHGVFTDMTGDEMYSNIMSKVNETKTTMKQQRTELEQFVLYARQGLQKQKMLHHETVRDLTLSWLEFQKNTSTEIKDMKKNLNRLEEENTMCQSKIENITHGYNEKMHKIEDKVNANQEKNEGLEKNDRELQKQINKQENMTVKMQQEMKELLTHMFVCQKGWKSFEHHCYIFSSEKKNWNQAWAFCQAMNSYLVELQTHDEIQFVGTLSTAIRLWIGASDNETEGTFIWNNSREPVSQSFWKSGEPNNANSGEQCAEVYYVQSAYGKFNDNSCSKSFNFVCEKIPTFDLHNI